MRERNVRLFSMSDVDRIDRDFQPVPADSFAHAAMRPEERRGLRLAALADTTLAKPAELTWRDWAVFLLHTAAEIEHALMVQYLYAAYSLGGPLSGEHAHLVRGWRDTLLTVAREEMGHLITIQNLLLLLGAPISFERHPHPWSSPFYPFEFNLDGLSMKSLACYVYAEMPSRLSNARHREVREKAIALVGKDSAPEVGLLYDRIIRLIADRKQIPDAAFDVDSYRYQVTWDEFGRGYRPNNQSPQASMTNAVPPRDERARVIVGQVVTRTDALAVLKDVAGQGEAEHYKLGDQSEPSHFDRFAKIFEEYDRIVADDPTWSPSRFVPRNPSADQLESSPPRTTSITSLSSRDWARLFNFRYRMLLLLLSYIYRVPREPASRLTSLRAQVLSRIFGEMYHMKTIAGILVVLPLSDPATELRAGPPFQIPFSLALSHSEEDFWRTQLNLLDSCAGLANQLLANKDGHLPPEGRRFLIALLELDRDARAWIERILTGGLFGWGIGT